MLAKGQDQPEATSVRGKSAAPSGARDAIRQTSGWTNQTINQPKIASYIADLKIKYGDTTLAAASAQNKSAVPPQGAQTRLYNGSVAIDAEGSGVVSRTQVNGMKPGFESFNRSTTRKFLFTTKAKA